MIWCGFAFAVLMLVVSRWLHVAPPQCRVVLYCAPQDRVQRRVDRVGLPVSEDPDREIAVMRALAGHPNVLQLLGVGKNDWAAYVVMPLALGGDLWGHVNRTALSEDDMRVAMRDTLRGIDHMHARNITHRDISLENTLIGAHHDIGAVQIMDFGLATTLQRDAAGVIQLSPGGITVGKEIYFAPEVRASGHAGAA